MNNLTDESAEAVKFLSNRLADDSIYRVVWKVKGTGEFRGQIYTSQTDAINAVTGENKHIELKCIEAWRNGRMIGSISVANKED